MVEIKDTAKRGVMNFVRQKSLLLLLFVILFALSVSIPSVKGSYFTNSQRTKIVLEYNDEKQSFFTDQTRLIDALYEQGIVVYDQDYFDIPQETRLNGGEVRVRVIKSWPIVISDNGEFIDGRTNSDDPAKILEQNKIEVWPADIVTTELILNPVTTGGVGQLVSIKRAPLYKILVDGKVKEVRTWDREVRVIIEESATKLNPNDIVSPGVKELVSNGSMIRITRINFADVSESEAIPFETIYQGSTSLAFGKIKAIVSGITGNKQKNYRITYKDGQELSKVLTSTKITQPKRDAKILRGALIGKASYVSDGVYPSMGTAFRGYKGRYLNVTNLDNGKSVKVKVVDYGPTLETGRIIDLGKDAFSVIGNPRSGVLNNVMVELLD